MPFKKPDGAQKPSAVIEQPLITEEVRLRWILKDAERFSGRKLSREEQLVTALHFVNLKRG